MRTIEIDFDVFKALTGLRDTESVTYNDVIRKLLGLESRCIGKADSKPGNQSRPSVSDLQCKGVAFPAGTEFRAKYKGQMHYGKIEGGHLVVDGKLTKNPSKAASVITHNSVNGWKFWECRLPGEVSWRLIDGMRGNT